MDRDLVNMLLSRLKELDPENTTGIEELETLTDKIFEEREELKKKASTEEYIEWLYNAATANDDVCTEHPLSKYTGIEAENRRLLHGFYYYLIDLAHEQGVPMIEDEDRDAPGDRIFVKIKDEYFAACRLLDGFELISFLAIDRIPEEKFVVLTKEEEERG